MKRSRFFITGALLLVVAAAAVAIVSCRKEAEGPLADKGQIVRNDLDAKAAIARITGFKRQVDLRKSEPGLRSMETMSLSDAVADIVELFNAVYAQPENFYVRTVRNSFTIDLPLTVDGKVLVDNVAAAYDRAIVLARQAYANDGISNGKGYVGLTVRLGDITDDTAELVFFSTSGQSGNHSAPDMGPDGPFGEDDDWLYKAPMGKCDGTPGSGADEQIERKITSLCYDWGRDPVTGQKYYYYDDTIFEFKGCDYRDYLFYRKGVTDLCIQDDEMDSLFHSTKHFLEHEGPVSKGLPVTGSNRYYLRRDFSIEGNPDQLSDDFLSHDIRHAHYVRRTLDWPVVVEPVDLLDE